MVGMVVDKGIFMKSQINVFFSNIKFLNYFNYKRLLGEK